MNVPAFIDLTEAEQVAELRAFLKGKGYDITEKNSEDGLHRDLQQIINVLDNVWKELSSEDLESLFNSIISLVLLVSPEQSEIINISLCEKLAKTQPGDKKAAVRVKLLNTLFQGLDERSSIRYIIYMSLIKLAGQADLMNVVNPDIDEIKKWLAQWDVSTLKMQNLFRTLYEAFQENKQSDKAMRALLELLATYSAENASEAREDAQKCIVACLSDPNTYLLDHLLALKPVKILEGGLTFNLLTIFISGRLHDYLNFYNANKDFVISLGLDHNRNVEKMRKLTFMQLAEGKSEITFEQIQNELQIRPNEVEPFIIDVIRTRKVRAKIDQMDRKVVVSYTTNRTFGRPQWQLLHQQLVDWERNINHVVVSLSSIGQQ